MSLQRHRDLEHQERAINLPGLRTGKNKHRVWEQGVEGKTILIIWIETTQTYRK